MTQMYCMQLCVRPILEKCKLLFSTIELKNLSTNLSSAWSIICNSSSMHFCSYISRTCSSVNPKFKFFESSKFLSFGVIGGKMATAVEGRVHLRETTILCIRLSIALLFESLRNLFVFLFFFL